MAYKGKNYPLGLAAPKHFRKMFPMIIRDGIALSGGKYVANEPLTLSEHRERPLFRLRIVFFPIHPESDREPKIDQKSSNFRFFRLKIRF